MLGFKKKEARWQSTRPQKRSFVVVSHTLGRRIRRGLFTVFFCDKNELDDKKRFVLCVIHLVDEFVEDDSKNELDEVFCCRVIHLIDEFVED